MYDQANHLRRLVRRCASQEAPARGRRPNLCMVASGKGGVGTTTLAVNLAVAMADDGLRTVLVDADLQGGDAAILCGVEQRHSLADVLEGRRKIGEAVQPGPGALRVLPGLWGLQRLPADPAAAVTRLLGEFDTLAAPADLVLLDAGKSPGPAMQPLWQTADLALVLTTPETSSIINTYALIKMLVEDNRALPIHLLVNLAPTAAVAQEVGRRLVEACRRFLGMQPIRAGHFPADPQVAKAALVGEPFAVAAPGCQATQHLRRLAASLAASLAVANSAGDRLAPPQNERPERQFQNFTDSQTPETPKFLENGKNDLTTRRLQPIASEHCR